MSGEMKWRRTVGLRKKSYSRKHLLEILEDRLVLSATLRPGPVADDVVLFPTAQPGEYQIAADPIAADDFTMIDLSVDTPEDQRHLLSLTQDTLVKVDTNEFYTLTTRSLNDANLATEVVPVDITLKIASYDVDQHLIEPIHVTRHSSAVDTVLAANLQPGDTSLFIQDASGWSNELWESAETRALAWYGYTDSTGHTYDDYTYTRYIASNLRDGLWEPGAIQFDSIAGSYRIDLLQPWDGPFLATGSAVRNAATATDLHITTQGAREDRFLNWENHVQKLGGGVWENGSPSSEMFLPGTVYIEADFSILATDIVISPEGDSIFGDPNDPTRSILSTPADQSITLDFDVLSKGVLNPLLDDTISDTNNDGMVNGTDFMAILRGLGDSFTPPYLFDWQANHGNAGTVTLDTVEDPMYGNASIATDTEGMPVIHYESDPWFVGTDIIRYTLSNSVTGETFESEIRVEVLGGNEQQNPGIVTTLENQALVVTGNDAPEKRFGDLSYTTAAGQTIVGDGIRNLDLLAYSIDPVDQLVVRLLDGPDNGSLYFNYDGSFEYIPSPGFSGTDTFQYEVFDGLHTTSAVASIDVLETTDQLLDFRTERIAEALLNYEDFYGRLPATSNFDAQGNPYLSWRVEILPFLEFGDLYNEFHHDEPWNSTNNLALIDQMPDYFRSIGDASDSISTRFQTLTGPDAPFGRETDGSDQRGPDLRQFADGLAHTLLFVESATDQAVPWTMPNDLVFDINDPIAAVGTITSGKINGVTADGKAITLPSTIAPDDFTAFVTMNGNEIIDAHALRRDYAESQGPEALEKYFADVGANYLYSIALAMLNYVSNTGRFPISSTSAELYDENGIPKVSWRVHLLPYLGYTSLYDQFNLDEPWDSPNNLPLLDQMPEVFRSPEDSSDSTTTRIMTLNGPEAGFGFFPSGVVQRGPRLSDIRDGLAQTIMFVEAGADVAVPWTKPDDLPFDTTDPFASLGTLEGDAFRLGMFDGSIVDAPTDITPEEFSALATRYGSNPNGSPSPEELLPEVPLVSYRQSTGATGGTYDVQNNMKEISLAMLNHEQGYETFPANSFAEDGTPLLSWRVHLLSFLGYESLFQQFHLDEPWDSPHNLALLEFMPDVFRSADSPADSTTTRMMTFVGEDAPFPSEGTGNREGIELWEIADGTSNTIGFVEAGPDVAVPWTKPVDLEFYPNNPFSVMGLLGDEFLVSYIDGSVKTLSSEITLTELAARITHNGGEDLDNLPSDTSTYQLYVNQTAGDTVTHEFGVDVFDVVLDKAPTSDVVINVVSSNTAVAVLDKQMLTFTPDNWNVPQRVAVRGVDNHVVNSDVDVDIFVVVNDTLSDDNYDNADAHIFTATILDDDLVPIPGDFDQDQSVDGDDLAIWQEGYGSQIAGVTDGDANGDNEVTGSDFLDWIRNYDADSVASTTNAAEPQAELVDAALAWSMSKVSSQEEEEEPGLTEEAITSSDTSLSSRQRHRANLRSLRAVQSLVEDRNLDDESEYLQEFDTAWEDFLPEDSLRKLTPGR